MRLLKILLFTFSIFLFLTNCVEQSSTTPEATPNPQKVTISFDSLGGSPVATQTVDYNSIAKEPEAPTHAVSNFKGWFTDSAATIPFFFTTPIISDLTLYAGWKIKEFTISFDSLGGSPVVTQTIDYNSVATEPVAPTHAISNFRGWFTDSSATIPFFFTTPIISDLTLYAGWKKKGLLTITFNSKGGTPVPGQDVAPDSTATLPSAPTRTGFNFIDWFAHSTETNDAFDFDTLITNDLTLYAGWEAISLTVSFDSLGGGTVESQTTRYGQTTTRPNDPTTNNNWLLYHWYTQAPSTPDDLYNINLIFQFSTLITNHLTLYAGYRQRPANRAELLTIVNKAITNNGDDANLNFIDTSLITNMNELFRSSTFNGKIDKWNVSSVTNMSEMFFSANQFNQEIGEWDVSKVENMYRMFGNANNFNQDIGEWDVANVTSMRRMFEHAQDFNQEIGKWNVSKVGDMHYMFGEADNFNKSITNWDVSSVTDMGYMFFSANSFNQKIGGWDVSKVENMYDMFGNANNFNQDIGEWDVTSVTSMSRMFYSARKFNQNLEKWKVLSTADISGMFSLSGVASTGNYPTWCTTKRGCRY